MLVRRCAHNDPGKIGEISPSSYSPQTPTGKRPKVCPRTSWSNFISDLAWYGLGVKPTELSEIAVDREVFRVLLGLLLSPLFAQRKSGHQNE